MDSIRLAKSITKALNAQAYKEKVVGQSSSDVADQSAIFTVLNRAFKGFIGWLTGEDYSEFSQNDIDDTVSSYTELRKDIKQALEDIKKNNALDKDQDIDIPITIHGIQRIFRLSQHTDNNYNTSISFSFTDLTQKLHRNENLEQFLALLELEECLDTTQPLVEQAVELYQKLTKNFEEHKRAFNEQVIKLALDIQNQVNAKTWDPQQNNLYRTQLESVLSVDKSDQEQLTTRLMTKKLVTLLVKLAKQSFISMKEKHILSDNSSDQTELQCFVGKLNAMRIEESLIISSLPNEVTRTVMSYVPLHEMALVSLATHHETKRLAKEIVFDFSKLRGNEAAFRRRLENLSGPTIKIEIKAGDKKNDPEFPPLFKQLCEVLSKNKNLKEIQLNASGCGLTDASAQHLTKLLNLTSLNLSSNNIGDKGMQFISKLINLISLDMSNNNIRFQGAKYIAKLTNLTSLNLKNNQIGAVGAAHIAKLINLTSLNLNNNQIGAVGAAHITNLINLTSLNLSFNRIGAAGKASLAALTNTHIIS